MSDDSGNLDDRMECPVCDGLGYHPCDDGSEMQCTRCDGTGKVRAVTADESDGRRKGIDPLEIPMGRVHQVAPATMARAMNGLSALGMAAERCGLERSLQELVKIRASQLNGCAMCLDMHTKDARAHGESEQRLSLIPAWRESTPFFTAREQAALAWTEAVTLVADGHVPDAVYEDVRQEFSDDDLVNLTLLVAAINAYNRVNVGLRTVPGFYQPGMFATRDAEPAIA